MRTLALIAMLGSFTISCSGESKTDDKNPPGDDDDDDDDDDDATPTGPTGDAGSGYIDPVAVGFEFDGVILPNGQLTGYNLDGYGYVPPTMYLFFASEQFFSSGEDSEYCIAAADFAPIPIAKPAQIPTHDNATLYTSYEVALDLYGHNCTGIVDPEIWGENAELLVEPFIGARIGYGWGPMTDYLRDAWGEDSITDYGHAMVATYIAVNDSAGRWVGEDWTTGLLFEWDPTNQTLVADDNDYLLPVDVSQTLGGQNLPEGYMRSFAYWYQDFPLMDFSNLRDGAPAQ